MFEVKLSMLETLDCISVAVLLTSAPFLILIDKHKISRVEKRICGVRLDTVHIEGVPRCVPVQIIPHKYARPLKNTQNLCGTLQTQ